MTHLADIALVLHAGATFAMTGLIWFVQLVHYPMMRLYPEQAFADIEAEHCRRTGWVAGPLMLAELGTAPVLLLPGVFGLPAGLSLLLLAAVWLVTWTVQVPLHSRLLRGYDAALLRRLVASNWVRTALWTARSACIAAVFFQIGLAPVPAAG